MINYGLKSSARGSNLSSASLLIFFFRICDCTWLFIVWTLYSVKTSMKLCCILTYYSQIVILCAALTHHWKKVPSSFLSHFCNSIIFKLKCDSFIIMDVLMAFVEYSNILTAVGNCKCTTSGVSLRFLEAGLRKSNHAVKKIASYKLLIFWGSQLILLVVTGYKR